LGYEDRRCWATCYLMMTGVEAVALIAPSAAGVETVLERHNSISFDDMCRQLVPLRDHSDAEKVLPDIQARSMFLQLVLVASSTVMGTFQLKEAPRVNILLPSQ